MALMLLPPPDGIEVPRRDRNNPYWEAVMSEIITVGLELAKHVCQAHGADSKGCASITQWL